MVRLPVLHKVSEVTRPNPEIVDMADAAIVKEAPRATLPAPIEGSHRPALAPPMIAAFEIFLDHIAASGLEQYGSFCAAHRSRPLRHAERPAVACKPILLRHSVWD